MLKAGKPIIVCDPAIWDIYCATVVQDEPDEIKRNPLVRIEGMIRYPTQQALIYSDIANENVPIPYASTCRLMFCGSCAHAINTDATFYNASVQQARKVEIGYWQLMMANGALEKLAQDIIDILHRHIRGEYGKARKLCTR